MNSAKQSRARLELQRINKDRAEESGTYPPREIIWVSYNFEKEKVMKNLATLLTVLGLSLGVHASVFAEVKSNSQQVTYKTVHVDDLDVFYREAGPSKAPTVLLLHGFPTSSHMFRNLIPELATKFHVIAPDYPGFGESSQPDRKNFAYTFDHLSLIVDHFTEKLKLDRFAIYVQDYGAPIGYRIATAHPERISGIVVQNGNAYIEGLPDSFWKPLKEYWKEPTPEHRAGLEKVLTIETTKWQYTVGTRDPSHVSPDNWVIDQARLDRPGNKDIQLDLFLDYGSNLPLYDSWHTYFRTKNPPMLIVWGKNDPIFPAEGATPYKRDVKNLEFHLLNTGHFALEEDSHEIAKFMLGFLKRTGLK